MQGLPASEVRIRRGGLMAGRWTVGEHVYEGTVFSVGPLKQYGNGQGVLREVIIKTTGTSSLEPETFVPVTLFGRDAQEAEGAKGRPIKAEVRLVSRQYEWNGEIRWSLQYTGSRVEIEATPNLGEVPPEAGSSRETGAFADDRAMDDMPF